MKFKQLRLLVLRTGRSGHMSDFCGEMRARLLVCHSYLPKETSDIYIGTEVLSARCPLADVPGSACNTPPPRHLGV